jgi:2-oxoglutarate dehydrogenase complex dehydrogenase (E1) component-like enzyme
MMKVLGIGLHRDMFFRTVSSGHYLFSALLRLPPFTFTFSLFITDTAKQLANRHENATLLRYVDSMRTYGHRAARIDPLDLIHREEVAALNPARYGLVDRERRYDVDGILWTKRVGEERRGREREEEMWTLDEIEEHLRRVYVGKIGYEVCLDPFEEVFSFLLIWECLF